MTTPPGARGSNVSRTPSPATSPRGRSGGAARGAAPEQPQQAHNHDPREYRSAPKPPPPPVKAPEAVGPSENDARRLSGDDVLRLGEANQTGTVASFFSAPPHPIALRWWESGASPRAPVTRCCRRGRRTRATLGSGAVQRRATVVRLCCAAARELRSSKVRRRTCHERSIARPRPPAGLDPASHFA